MAFSTQRVTSDGTLDQLDLSIDYLSRDDIGVFFNGLPAPEGEWAWVGETDSTIEFTPDVPDGVEVLLQRTTKLDKMIHIFTQGAAFNNATMDGDFLQLLFLTQEAVEGSGITDIFNDVDYHGNRITNLGTAVDPSDAVSLGQATSVTSTHAAAAAASAARAEQWATQTDTPVGDDLYGAKYYADQAETVLANTVQVDASNVFTEPQQFPAGASFSGLTAGRALTLDGSGNVSTSATSAVELAYLVGVTSPVQTQLSGKQATVTGGATTITASNLTASRALVSDASGKVVVSAVTATEIGYLDGVTSAIQTQLNAKVTWPGVTNASDTTTTFTVGTTIAAYVGSTVTKGQNETLSLGSNDLSYAGNGTTQDTSTKLAGTWDCRGYIAGERAIYQRIT